LLSARSFGGNAPASASGSVAVATSARRRERLLDQVGFLLRAELGLLAAQPVEFGDDQRVTAAAGREGFSLAT